jgi:hypothetical protein
VLVGPRPLGQHGPRLLEAVSEITIRTLVRTGGPKGPLFYLRAGTVPHRLSAGSGEAVHAFRPAPGTRQRPTSIDSPDSPARRVPCSEGDHEWLSKVVRAVNGL